MTIAVKFTRVALPDWAAQRTRPTVVESLRYDGSGL